MVRFPNRNTEVINDVGVRSDLLDGEQTTLATSWMRGGGDDTYGDKRGMRGMRG